MRIHLQEAQAELVFTSLVKTHQAAVEKATAYSYDLSDTNSYNEYLKLRNAELEIARVVHLFKMQMIQPINEAEPLADWEKDLLSGKNPSSL